MNISFHLHFNGNCREAFGFYETVFHAKIGTMLCYGDSPSAGSVSTDWQEKIIHGDMSLNGVTLVGGDVPAEQYEIPQGFYILIGIDSGAETKTVFSKLAENGTVIMPLQKTFWSSSYGIVVDQFGIRWKINHNASST